MWGYAMTSGRPVASEIVLGVGGFLIVIATLVGGFLAAGALDELVTPNVDSDYLAWLWLGMGPFLWLAQRVLGYGFTLLDYLSLLVAMIGLSFVCEWLALSPLPQLFLTACVWSCWLGLRQIIAARSHEEPSPSQLRDP